MSTLASIDTALERKGILVFGGLSCLIAMAWASIAFMTFAMRGGIHVMSPSAPMVASEEPHEPAVLAMWIAMMIAMMLPTAMPTFVAYARAMRTGTQEAYDLRASKAWPLRVYAFAAGYLLVWLDFCIVATGLQLWLRSWTLLSPAMELRGWVAVTLLLVAGVYQLTGAKRACLNHCRSPLRSITGHWLNGIDGALQMGITHGIFCLGCCWALMLLLFVFGVMNPWAIVALTLFVLLEKLTPFGVRRSRFAGVLLIAAAAWLWR